MHRLTDRLINAAAVFLFSKTHNYHSVSTARKTQCGFISLDEGGHNLLNQQSENIN